MMKRYRRTAVSQYLVVTLILFVIIGVGLLGFLVQARVTFSDHFVIPWAAGRTWLLEGESPYAHAAIETASEALENSSFKAQLPESQGFTQPILSLIFYLPFSLMPYVIARTLWVTLLGLSVGLIGFLSIRLSGWKLPAFGSFWVVLMMVFWLPSVAAILGGFISPVIVGMILLGIYLIMIGQDTTAGFVLALTVSSFLTSGLVLIFLIIWSLSHKRWSIITSFFSGLIFLILLSFLILPSWFTEWASVLLNLNDGWNWINTPLMDLAALLPGIESPLVLFLHGIFSFYALFLVITALGQVGRVFIYKIFAFLVIVYLLHFQGSMNYLFFTMPALLLIFRFWSERWKRLGTLVSWSLLILVSVGSWLFFYSEIDFTQSMGTMLFYLGFPLFIWVGMVWIRWWALTIPELPYKAN